MNEKTHTSPEQSADTAALYALGTLSPSEVEEFESRILAGQVDPVELDESLQAMTALCEEVASVMPTPRRAVKDSIMAAIGAPPEREQVFLYAHEGEWQEIMPGISLRLLHEDPVQGRTMVLARLQPGAAYPPHRHMGLEQCLVLEGDLHVDGHDLRSGDFTASYFNKIHIDTHSKEGCLLLLTTPLNDEILDHGNDASPAG
ncbi:MAG TPA: cupin domain-containing protein [Candidatus Kapabacteria bacterium]|nr:cupin domain-containing protein [Candidatus Kapabacteria bacterium]